ncbi:P4 family phage/plasmid primase-like protein [Mycobacterium sp. MAA66]|uniref:DNA primase family protein n=1 Tax=Mycobacterium sp. MAA66 TaxID=3156297 RepID=UPI00351671A1
MAVTALPGDAAVVPFRPAGGAGQGAECADLWPAPDNPRHVAQRVVDMAASKAQPLRYWNGLWLYWTGVYFHQISVEGIRDNLYEMLCDAQYLGSESRVLRWKPNTPKLNGVIDAARGLVKVQEGVDPPCWLDGREDPVIACRNGLLRTADRVLLSHTTDYFNVMALPFDYNDSSSRPNRWLRFLDEVFPGDRESIDTLQEWFGYIISGRRDLEKMLMVIGRPRSGKGTITHVLERLIGPDNCAGLSGDHFRNDFAYQPLLGKSLATFTDARLSFGKQLVEAILRITGGDTVSVNRKNKEQVSLKLPTRLMFMSNEIPVLPDDSGAVQSRLVPLYMGVSFDGKGSNPKPDPRLKQELIDELPSILIWALDGLDRLRERGTFITPKSAANCMDVLGEGGSPIKQFLLERCEFGNHHDYYVTKDELYSAHRCWSYDNGYELITKATLTRKLMTAVPDVAPKVTFNPHSKRGSRGQQRPAYSGIRLRGAPK